MRHTESSSLDAAQAVHHQIGNSLQSVASLLNMESRGAPPQAAAVLSEAGRRVRTVMHLHQRLQESVGDVVRLDDLLGDICRDVAGLDALDRNAEIRVDVHPLYARSKTASALAMITAEWLGNSLEHGLADRAGIVEVTMNPTADGARLTVSDNGVGSRDGDWSSGFGLSLVSRLAAQLGGAVTRTVTPAGSCFELVCPGVWGEAACP